MVVDLSAIETVLNNTQVDGENASKLWQDPAGDVTLRNGDVVANLRKRLESIGFQVPVAFSSGLGANDSTFTTSYLGVTYYANPTEVPFVTTSTFDPSQWLLLVDTTKFNTLQDLKADNSTYVDGTYASALLGGSAYISVAAGGEFTNAGGQHWNVVSGPSYAKRNAASATDFALHPDGVVGSMGGLDYKTDSTQTGTASATNDLGQDGIVPHGFARLAHYGAIADANVALSTGTDNTAAIDAWFAFIALPGNTGMLDGIYRYVGQMDIPEGVNCLSIGRDKCGFLIEIDSTMSCFVSRDKGGYMTDFTVWRYMTEAKVGDDIGHLGNVMMFGWYLDGAQTEMGHWRFGNVRLTETPQSFPTIALGFFGNVNDVHFNSLVIDSPNANGMVYGYQTHWSGNITAIGQTVTETYHPRNIHISDLDMPEGVKLGGVFSAASDILIDKWTARDLDRMLWGLAGDEVDDFASDDQKPIRRGMKIGQAFMQGTQAGSYNEFIQILGAGASKFRNDTDGTALEQNLDTMLEIGQLTVIGDNNMQDCVTFQGVTGQIKVGQSDISGFTRYSVVGRNSIGKFQISVKATDEVRMENVIGHDLNVDVDRENAAGSYGVYLMGETETVTTSGALLAGATEITIAAGLSERLPRGSIISFGDIAIRTTKYSGVGDTTIDVEALTDPIPDATALDIIKRCDGRVTGSVQRAATSGVRVLNATAHLDTIKTTSCGVRGIHGTDSEVTITSPLCQNPTYDIMFNGESVGTIVGGRTGFNANGVSPNNSINAEGTSRVSAYGTRVGKVSFACRRVLAGAKFRSYGAIDANGDFIPDAN